MRIRLAFACCAGSLLPLLFHAACWAQQRSLADLLLEAEATDTATAHDSVAASEKDPKATANAMRRLIQERRTIVDDADMFSTLREIITEEQKQVRFLQAVQVAVRAQKVAKHELDVVSGLARGGGPGPGPGDVAAAQSRFNDATRNLADAQREAMDNYRARLAPRYERVSKALPAFFDTYGRMRQLFTHSRRDPAREALLMELEEGKRRCDNFAEGHVLTGIMQTYAGKHAEAEAAFTQASDVNMRHGLVFTPLGYDCCYGLILLGKADTLEDYIGRLRKFPPTQQTAVCCWLIGSHSLAKRKYNDASSFLVKAVSKAKDRASPQLRGETALMYLLVDNKVNVEKATQLLDGLHDSPSWQAQRANASLAAAEENWTKAVALMDACIAAAPPRFAEELEQQRSAYEESAPWRLPTPNASRKK